MKLVHCHRNSVIDPDILSAFPHRYNNGTLHQFFNLLDARVIVIFEKIPIYEESAQLGAVRLLFKKSTLNSVIII